MGKTLRQVLIAVLENIEVGEKIIKEKTVKNVTKGKDIKILKIKTDKNSEDLPGTVLFDDLW